MTGMAAQAASGKTRRSGGSGWLIGAVLGILAGLWAFPPVRYTLAAQLEFALAENSLPWVRALDSRRSVREVSRLDGVAQAAPSDYLLQVGRATVAASEQSLPHRASLSPPEADIETDRSLVRLGLVARAFPENSGAYAHLARYMMSERVRIERVEPETPDDTEFASAPTAEASPPAPRSIPARRKDVRLMEWALRSGETRDRSNAFWPTMLAVTYFAAQRDPEALEALARAKSKTRWDSYLYEEILGQWRLYSAAYGDNGAAQKVGPLSFAVFPHLREIRRMAEMARWRAERALQDGDMDEAVRIRRNLARLGILIRDKAQWAYESLYGTDLLFIATTPLDTRLRPNAITSLKDWEREAHTYIVLLQDSGRSRELSFFRNEVEKSCALRQQVDIARNDATLPGIPPGIPLAGLFGNWMAGVCLLQEVLTLIVAGGLAALWLRLRAQPRPFSRLERLIGLTALLGIVGTSSAQLVIVGPSSRAAVVLFTGLTLLLVLVLDMLFFHLRTAFLPGDAGTPSTPRWTTETTLAMTALLLLPGLLALYYLRPALSTLHPIAMLLTSVLTTSRHATLGNALKLGLLACALPLGVMLISAVRALFQASSPLAGALIGLRRTALPMIACLAMVYFLLLNRTLRLDATASRAINLAAQNDLQWVLTHTSADEE